MTDQADGEKIRGVVKWFNPTKGFGFIQLPGGGMDVFVHVNQLRKSGIHRSLETGEPVTFRTERGTKGPFAVEVTLVEAQAGTEATTS